MKKITDNKYLTEFQKLFFSEDYVDSSPNALTSFEQEAFYQKTVDNLLDNKILFNKSYGDIFYTKKNNKNKIILPKTEFIKSIDINKTDVSALNFVADSYKNLITEWKSLKRSGVLTEKQSLDISLESGYRNFENEYQVHLGKYLQLFFIFVQIKKYDHKIKNFQDFLHTFSEFLSIHSKNNPFTITKFVESRFCPDSVSGLLLKTNIKMQNNYTEREKLIKSPQFDLLNNLALKYGFIIDKNNPKNMYFNIHSPNSQEAINKYLQTNQTVKNNFYENFFIETEQYDLYYLQEYCLESYNIYRTIQPTFTVDENISCKGYQKSISKVVERQAITDREVQQILNSPSDLIWWRFFIFTKLCEENKEINQDRFEKLVEKSFEIYERLDMAASIAYISSQMRSLPRSAAKERNFSY